MLADEAVASNRIRASGTFKTYGWPLAVNVITVLVIFIVTVVVPVPREPGSKELLNQIYLPAGIDVELKLATNEVPLIVQFTVVAGLTVTTRFCVFVHPLAVNV